jgi:TRAP-type uncharacterized transport system fused permease subunit
MTQSGVVLGEHAFREVPAERARTLSPCLDRWVGLAGFLIAGLVMWHVFVPPGKGEPYYLIIFLGLTLPLVFLCYHPDPRRRKSAEVKGRGQDTDRASTADQRPPIDTPGALDWVLAGLALVVGLYPVLPVEIGAGGGGFDAFLDRNGTLSDVDIVAGTSLLLLILEAARRTTGLILPVVCLLFLGYSYYGGYLPREWVIAHAGVDFSQIINGCYLEFSGFYGTPLGAAASYIVLFNIYGAVLDASGAGKFFVDISHTVFRRSRTAPGRTTALSGFLLGTVSGSGTATTVSLSAVAWPTLRDAKYPKENAGGLLAASGIGAMLSPPTLGAAAFIIAGYLSVSYFEVLMWAVVPTLLYYLGIMLAVGADARKFGAVPVDRAAESPWRLLLRGGHHFVSLAIIVVFLTLDILPFAAVVYATVMSAVFALATKLIRVQRF